MATNTNQGFRVSAREPIDLRVVGNVKPWLNTEIITESGNANSHVAYLGMVSGDTTDNSVWMLNSLTQVNTQAGWTQISVPELPDGDGTTQLRGLQVTGSAGSPSYSWTNITSGGGGGTTIRQGPDFPTAAQTVGDFFFLTNQDTVTIGSDTHIYRPGFYRFFGGSDAGLFWQTAKTLESGEVDTDNIVDDAVTNDKIQPRSVDGDSITANDISLNHLKRDPRITPSLDLQGVVKYVANLAGGTNTAVPTGTIFNATSMSFGTPGAGGRAGWNFTGINLANLPTGVTDFRQIFKEGYRIIVTWNDGAARTATGYVRVEPTVPPNNTLLSLQMAQTSGDAIPTIPITVLTIAISEDHGFHVDLIKDEDILSSTITGGKIANSTIAAGNLADDAVTNDKILDRTIGAPKLNLPSPNGYYVPAVIGAYTGTPVAFPAGLFVTDTDVAYVYGELAFHVRRGILTSGSEASELLTMFPLNSTVTIGTRTAVVSGNAIFEGGPANILTGNTGLVDIVKIPVTHTTNWQSFQQYNDVNMNSDVGIGSTVGTEVYNGNIIQHLVDSVASTDVKSEWDGAQYVTSGSSTITGVSVVITKRSIQLNNSTNRTLFGFIYSNRLEIWTTINQTAGTRLLVQNFVG